MLGATVAPAGARSGPTPSVRLVPDSGPTGGEQPSPTCSVTVAGENPENDALQRAINDYPGGTICVGPGVYPEQLTIAAPGTTIVGSGNASTIIEPNAPLATNTFDFDSAASYAALTPAVAIVLVQNTTDVTLENLAVDGVNAAATFTGCGVDFFGVDFQNSSGTLSGSTVTNIELPTNLFGCQPGTGVYAYHGYFLTNDVPSPAVAVTIASSTITAYDKNGITCDDPGETCTISGNTIAGVGPTPLIAQNGIQVGFGASATVANNTVTGNHYTGPSVPTDGDYFEPGAVATGILVYDAGSVLSVTGDSLRGNDVGVFVGGTASATVASNSIEQGFDYGIVFDLNASTAWVGYPIYSTDTPWSSTASDNTIQDSNVGILIYDDNVTVRGGSISNVNVSLESVLDDAAASYSIAIDSLTAEANVSGALLGNVSGFQPAPGLYPTDGGAYSLVDDSFVANPAADAAVVQDGVDLNATSVTIDSCQVSGFVVGIYVNPTVDAATIEHSTVNGSAALEEPVWGIWVGNQAPLGDDTGSVVIADNVVTGPGDLTDSPLAGGAGIVAGGASVAITGNTVTDFSAVLGDVPTNATGSGSGYDWWEGTQSVGVLVGCPVTSSAAACSVEGNAIRDNTIGVVVLLTDLTFSTAYDTGPITIAGNSITDSGGYGLFTEMDWSGAGYGPTSFIDNNSFNDTLTGAPAMVLSGQTFDVANNVLIGTSATGDQGPTQGQGGGPLLATATVEATDYWTTGYDNVTLNANVFLDTDRLCSSTFAPGSQSVLSCGELVSFAESGLPAGTAWSVTLAGTAATVPAPGSILADLQNRSSPYPFSVTPPPGYEVRPSTGPGYALEPTGGTVTMSGTGVTVPVAFAPGLVVALSPASASIALGASVEYAVSVAGGFAPVSWTLEASGSPANLTAETFSPVRAGVYTVYLNVTDGSGAHAQATATVAVGATVTFVEGAPYLPARYSWSVAYDGSLRSTNGRSISFALGAEASSYVVRGPHGWQASPATGTIPDTGSDVEVPVTFAHGETFVLRVHEVGAAPGSTWCVLISAPFCSSTSVVLVGNLTPAYYTYSLAPVGTATLLVKVGSSWGVQNGAATLPPHDLVPAVTVQVRFAYPVTFTESGLSGAYSWSVRAEGEVGSSSADPIVLYLTNGSVAYSASGVAGFVRSYSNLPPRVLVDGAPESVAVTYVPR